MALRVATGHCEDMSDFIRSQIDYIFFICGFGYVVLATMCFTIRRTAGSRIPWDWLGAFSLLRGIDGWLNVLSYGFDGHPWIVTLRLTLQVTAYACLIEFARLATQRIWGKSPGRWIHLILLSIVALGGTQTSATASALARYVLFGPGSVWAVAVLLAKMRYSTGAARGPLKSAVCAMVLLTLFGLLPHKAPMIFAQVINRESFLETLKMPAEVFQSLLAAWLAASLWGYCGSLTAQARGDQNGGSTVRRMAGYTVVTVAIILAVGWVVTQVMGHRTDAAGRRSLLLRTMTAAAGIDRSVVASLSGSSKDYETSAHRKLRRQLKAIHDCNPDCRFVYIMGIRKNKIVFLVDSEPASSGAYSPPGSAYTDSTPQLRAALSKPDSFVEGPVADQWGSWVSGLVSLGNPRTRSVVGVLGMDVNARHWAGTVANQRLQCIIVVLLLCAIAIACFYLLYGAQESNARITESESHYRGLVEGSPAWVSLFDNEGKFLTINQTGALSTGWSLKDIIGKPFSEIWPDNVRPMASSCVKRVLHGARRSFEADCVCPNGREMNWNVVLNPIVDPDGHVRRFVGILTDIAERKRTQQALEESQRALSTLLGNLPGMAYRCLNDDTWTMEFVSDGCTELTGYRPAEMIGPKGISFATLVHPDDTARKRDEVQQAVRAMRGFRLAYRITTAYGEEKWVWEHGRAVASPEGGPEVLEGFITDITEQKRAEEALVESQRRYRLLAQAINAASDLIVITNVEAQIEFVNAAFERETGYAMSEVLGKNPNILKSGKQEREFYENLWSTILAGNTWQGEMVNRRKDGSIYVEDMSITPVKNSSGAIEHFVAIKRNITEKKVYERKLDHLAHHDHLTGLPNRLLFSDRLTQSIAYAQRRSKLVAVMFLDLDRFKYINDTLGHNVGDDLLRQASHRLRMTLRRADTIARMGGDEFTIILGDVENSEAAIRVGGKVLEAISKPFMIDDKELFITGSIGISVYPVDGVDVETLVRNADTAMYHAKEEGRNTCHLYTEELNTAAMERMTMESSLRKALERNEFVVYYQPRVDLRTGRILGAEALVRWKHPELGLVSPAQFIPLCEETGLIMPLSDLVLRESCRQNKEWQDAGHEPVSVAVNISARQVEQKELKATITRILKETGLDPRYLDLELTESTLMQNPERATGVLRKLKEMGVRISIDDFGTGYSSLSYLKQFPVDAVKIDQSFVRHVTTNPDDAAIAGAVVAMAHSLNLTVIAEGVETLQQLEFLKGLNCDEMQGYFVSRPVPASEFEDILRESALRPDTWLSQAA